MAIRTGINTQLKGFVGGWTFTQVGGRTEAKQIPPHPLTETLWII